MLAYKTNAAFGGRDWQDNRCSGCTEVWTTTDQHTVACSGVSRALHCQLTAHKTLYVLASTSKSHALQEPLLTCYRVRLHTTQSGMSICKRIHSLLLVMGLIVPVREALHRKLGNCGRLAR